MSRIVSWLERWRVYGDWLVAERRWLDEHRAKLRLLTDEQLSAFPECWRCDGNGCCGGGIRKELCHACWGKGFLDGSEDRQSAFHHEKPIRPRTRRDNIGKATACALALLLTACGTAPQYQLRAYISDGGACLESEAACGAPNTTCAVSVDFQLDCTGYDNSVTESVAFDVERREISIVATGCRENGGLCGTVRAWVRFADDGSVSGIGEIVEYGVPFVVHGGLL